MLRSLSEEMNGTLNEGTTHRLLRYRRECCKRSKGRSAERTAWSVLTERWRATAFLLREHDGTTDDMHAHKLRHVSTNDERHMTHTDLKPLFNLLHEHVSVGCEAIDRKYGLVGSKV